MEVSPAALALPGGLGRYPGNAASHIGVVLFCSTQSKGAQNYELRPFSASPAFPPRISNSDDEIAAGLRRLPKGHSGASAEWPLRRIAGVESSVRRDTKQTGCLVVPNSGDLQMGSCTRSQCKSHLNGTNLAGSASASIRRRASATCR